VRIILIEFTWQVKDLINNKDFYKRDIIVSLDPESSYILKINNIPYFETYHFCNHKELRLRYKELTYHTIKIAKVLDQALWNTDKRYKNLNWEFFNDYHYILKINFDQLFYYSELISKLIEKYNPSEIIAAETNKILINDNFLIDSNTSVIKFLLKTIEDNHDKLKISFVSRNKNEKFTTLSLSFNNFIKRKIVNIYYKINFLINCYIFKFKYLSIGSIDILRYKKLYPKESKFFLCYQHKNFNKKKIINNSIFFDSFMHYLKNETKYYELIKHKDISFRLIFHEIVFKLVNQLDFFLNEYSKAKKIIDRIKPVCVIFSTMAPFEPKTIVFRKICIDYKIPFVTWAHGGYGGTYSLCGYDITDFRFSKNHISYGDHMKNLVEHDKCIINKLQLSSKQKILPVGSVRLDYQNKKKKLKKSLKNNNKKTVVFFMGSIVHKNQFYFGRDREKAETSNWEFHYDILNLLKKYQNKYNIIFKDYPNGYKNLWKKVLIDISANKISYISNEKKVADLLATSDLNIITWTSNNFFEALYFDADMFVIEEDIYEEPFKDKLKDEIFYFKDEKSFLIKLENYLKIGNFYTCNKKNSQNFFLKFDRLNKRNELLNDSLSKLI
jgi:hypothetical protein